MKPTATLNQLLEGLTVGTQTKTHCEWCGHEFDEGDVAIVLFTQTADANRWEVHRIYCKACNPSTIARPVLDRAKLLVQCRLGTPTDVATQPTELVIFEPELIDSSEPAESGSAIVETDDVDSRPTPDESVSVEIETLPPSFSVPATHRHPVTGNSVEPTDRPEKPPTESDGNAD